MPLPNSVNWPCSVRNATTLIAISAYVTRGTAAISRRRITLRALLGALRAAHADGRRRHAVGADRPAAVRAGDPRLARGMAIAGGHFAGQSLAWRQPRRDVSAPRASGAARGRRLSDRRTACASRARGRASARSAAARSSAGRRTRQRPLELLRAPARAQQHERGAGGAAGDDRRRRAHPVARVAHRRELPRLELVGGELGDRRQRRPRGARRDPRAARPARALRAAGSRSCGSASLIGGRSLRGSPTISSSCLIARWISTLVAPSERPSARAISRLSMPRAKRMISASRRSSGSCCTPVEHAAQLVAPLDELLGRVQRRQRCCVSSIGEAGLRERSR